jgi:hypothetical protein
MACRYRQKHLEKDQSILRNRNCYAGGILDTAVDGLASCCSVQCSARASASAGKIAAAEKCMQRNNRFNPLMVGV